MGGGTWFLGVDLGTTYTAAAVRRDDRSEIVTLGTRAAAEPTVVVATDEGLVVGEAAERRAGASPERAVRQFKRRLGDTTPVLLGGVPYSPQALLAAVLEDVVERTTTEQGGPPERVAIAHPANWGPYKRELVRQVAELAGLAPAQVRTITEPVAAAVHYASQAGLEPGSVVAVYDLGGGTFDAAVVRIGAAGAELLGEPTGIEHLGGIDVDAAVLGHVRDALGPRFDALEAEEHAGLLARLREECVRAKEALSTDTDTVVGVTLPDGYVEVRLTRAELEAMVRPALAPTADALRRAITSAGLAPEDLAGVLLVGGSSRIPLVSELVSGALGRPVLLDAHPKHAVALGAAAHAAGDRVDDGAVPVVAPDEALDATAAFHLATAAGPQRGRRRRAVAIAVLAVAALLLGGVAAAQLGADDPDDEVATDDGDETTTTADDETTSTDAGSTTSTETTSSTTTDPDGGTPSTTRDPGGPGPDPGPGTTSPPAPPSPTTAPSTTQPAANPGPVGNLRTTAAVVAAVNQNDIATSVRTTLTWTAPSSTGNRPILEYRVFRRLRSPSGDGTRQHVETVTGTTAQVTLPYVETSTPALSYIEWDVVAVNTANRTSSPVVAQATAIDVRSQFEWNAYALLRNLGLRPTSGGTPLDCGKQQFVVCTQSVTSGPHPPGTTVQIRAQS